MRATEGASQVMCYEKSRANTTSYAACFGIRDEYEYSYRYCNSSAWQQACAAADDGAGGG